MALTVITEQNMASFQPILPKGLVLRKAMLFGCVEDGVACASAVVEDMKEQYNLSWLWVAEEYRRKGIGRELLDTVCRFAMQRGGRWIGVSYPTDAAWTGIFRYMLFQQGFRLQMQVLPQYRLSREVLSEAWFMKNMDGKKESQSIIPLYRLDEQLRKAMIERAEYRKQYMVSRADFDAVDRSCSMILMKDGEPKGITLIQKVDEMGVMSLELFYLDPKCAMSGMALLRQTVQAILQKEEMKELHFTCVSDGASQLAQRILGDTGREDCRVFSGTLDLDFYRWRGKGNV